MVESIDRARNIVRSTGVWSLGDGKSVRAFMDPWILECYEQLLGTHPVTEAQARTRVEEWIETVQRTWKENVVSKTVSQEEAQIILNTPILDVSREDELKWTF